MSTDIETNRPSLMIYKDRELWIWGSVVTLKVLGEETGGAYAVMEYVAQPGAGAGMHIHHNEDESFYMLEGTMTFQLGDEKIAATGGGDIPFVRIPKGVAHAFLNSGDTAARSLVIVSPAGLEGFFVDMAELAKAHPGGPPSQEAVLAIFHKYDVTFP